MKKKKSSLFFMPLLVIISIIILTSLWIVLLSKNQLINNPIGKRQFDLLKTYVEGESVLFYIDKSSKYALQQSIYDLAQNGGSAIIEDEEGIVLQEVGSSTSEAKCGKFDGYNIWYKLVKDELGNYEKVSCFEQNQLSTNLQYTFNKNLNQYLLSHPHNIPINNYYYELRGNLEIIGYAIEPLKFDILKDEVKDVFKKPIDIKIPITSIEPEKIKEKPTEEPKEKPTEAKIPIETKDFVDFTRTDLCAKGVNCRLTKEAYDLLLKADAIAKKRLKELGIKHSCLDNEMALCLKVNSAYRSYWQQKAIWEGHVKVYPDVKVRRKFVANPDECGNNCPHFTGNAIDVVFQWRTTKTMARYEWEILHEAMSKAGWVRYGDEKIFTMGERWHFECCNTPRYARAKEKGLTAIV